MIIGYDFAMAHGAFAPSMDAVCSFVDEINFSFKRNIEFHIFELFEIIHPLEFILIPR